MASLAVSIRELGVLQPVLVKELPGDETAYELIAGERRWRAARRAGLQTIPVLAQAPSGDAQSLEQALVENLHREDLNPLEEASAYQQLIDDFSFTHEQVAKRVGKSRAAVTNTLRLLQLPAGVQRALADSTISAGHARALLGTPDRSLQEALVARVLSEGLTVRAVEDEIRRSQERLVATEATGVSSDTFESNAPGPSTTSGTTTGSTEPTRGSSRRHLPEPGLLELEELVASLLNTRVKVDLKNQKGRLVIEFATLEDLERIYRTMAGQQAD
jgi:ParB family chromosome partitioning protein